jgi:Pyruvate:ferredoxin oxidoreductase and related 2-oxoacid:ferredoxin oxidoreductases, beta subunit
MAPTTLIGQKTTTTPHGKAVEFAGNPVNMAELIAGFEGCFSSERVAVNTPANIRKTKKAIEKAFQFQTEGKGLTFVEVLSPCPTGWGVKPLKAMEWVGGPLMEQYPTGVFKAPGEAV